MIKLLIGTKDIALRKNTDNARMAGYIALAPDLLARGIELVSYADVLQP